MIIFFLCAMVAIGHVRPTKKHLPAKIFKESWTGLSGLSALVFGDKGLRD